MPKLISNKDRPRDHKSLATEYWDPLKIEKKMHNLTFKTWITKPKNSKVDNFLNSFIFNFIKINFKLGFLRIKVLKYYCAEFLACSFLC